MDPLERSQTRLSDNMMTLNGADTHAALARLFSGKCAFCETLTITEVYRFRPRSSATPEADNGHLYYTWLATAWENIYPICRRCIPRQREYFPVAGRRAPLPSIEQLTRFANKGEGLWGDYPIDEKTLLLDPCRNSSFDNHFLPSISGALIEMSRMGRATIEHFSLNRPQLVAARKAQLSGYRDALLIHGLPDLHLYQVDNASLFDFARMEFGGSWYLLCRQIIAHLSTIFGLELDDSRARIGHSFQLIFSNPQFENHREDLFEWLEGENISRLPIPEKNSPEATEPQQAVGVDKPVVPPPVYPVLRSIELNHFKSIEHLKLHLAQPSSEVLSGEVQQPAMLILGENATGKSSILEATALALSSVMTRKSLKLEAGEWVLDPKQLGALNQERLTSAQVRLSFDNGRQSVLDIDAGGWKPLRRSSKVPPVFAYGAFRQFRKHGGAYQPDHCITNLFHSDQLLPDPEPWLVNLASPGEFDDVARALRLILAVQEEFNVFIKSADGTQCLIVTRHADQESQTPLSQVSSGYRAVLAMACDIMRRLMDRTINPHYQSLENARAIVLIDEVEAHLHPRWKIQIMGALRAALPNVTFIVTSHDPLCVRGMHHREVVVVHRNGRTPDNNSRHSVRIEQLKDLPDITQLTVEQLLTSDFFSLASTDQPLMNLKLAKVADLLSASNAGEDLDADKEAVVALFKQQINDVLPVGSTEGQRLVQTAVAEFLQDRAKASSEKLKDLNVKAKAKIRAYLESF
ncbi:AAA family ATPase [Pseudomonas azotoformans]|uniref:AAA family ATPase n=1 Tax=Pseudomonas azotoformans TaxID=47878 RepID=UPI00141AC0BA|nr:AAA family ATPase [Pseudomonas azotoformans]